MRALLVLWTLSSFIATAAFHVYTHTCQIPTRARSVFTFKSEDDCVYQRNALIGTVTPGVELDHTLEKSEDGLACVYKSSSETWTQVNTWAQYPRGLSLKEWQLDARTSPVKLTFVHDPDTLVCNASVPCITADTTCTTPGSSFCAGAIIAAWVISVYFTFTRRHE